MHTRKYCQRVIFRYQEYPYFLLHRHRGGPSDILPTGRDCDTDRRGGLPQRPGGDRRRGGISGAPRGKGGFWQGQGGRRWAGFSCGRGASHRSESGWMSAQGGRRSRTGAISRQVVRRQGRDLTAPPLISSPPLRSQRGGRSASSTQAWASERCLRNSAACRKRSAATGTLIASSPRWIEKA